MSELSAYEQITVAIDTTDRYEAGRWCGTMMDCGAVTVKFGLKLACAESWMWCSRLAGQRRLDWIADAKLDDIPETVVGAVEALRGLPHPPIGITMHTSAGPEAMQGAQEAAGPIKILGVTVLTSITDEQAIRQYGKPARQKVLEYAEDAGAAGLAGAVCSPHEITAIRQNEQAGELFLMVPGIRPVGADAGDQARFATPGAAIRSGANLLVVGRPITQAPDQATAFNAIVAEVEAARAAA
jgi:orotidine-5'-phosphate decarboxylase